jgi:hypothetical protein
MKQANRITSSTDARYEIVGESPLTIEYLCSRLAADNTLKVSDHHWVWMRSKRLSRAGSECLRHW